MHLRAAFRVVVLASSLACRPALLAEESVPAPGPIAPGLQPLVEKHSLAGAVVLVANKEKILDVEAVGFADVGNARPMAPDALFWIASQTKPMTATAVMMLVEEGKIDLDKPVETYLPEFKGQMVIAEQDANHMLLKKPAHPITVREILSHMSGMPFKSKLEEPTLDALALPLAVRSYGMTPLQTEPGTKYAYANAGINTAARILEVVTGQAYEEFMEARLFTPLGLKDTTFWPDDEQVARLAKSYKPNEAKTDLEEIELTQLSYPLTDRVERFPMPAGGLFSTVADVARFCQMILNGGELDGHRYLSEASVKEMTKRQTPAAVKESYGLGWQVVGGSFGHGGAYATSMNIYPEKNLITVFMVQHAGFPGEGGKSQEIFRKAAEEMFGGK